MKKSFLFFSFILFINGLQAVVLKTSWDRGEYIELLGHKKLTVQWAQEYIGSDLVQEELRDLNVDPIKMAIFDLGFEQEHVSLNQPIEVPPQLNGNRTMRAHHGTSVASVINGASPYGHSGQVDLIQLSAITYPSYYSYAFRKFEKEDNYPKIISNSLGWTSDSIVKVAEQAFDKNILWFLASGNSWPQEVRQREIESKALLVGSFAPNGLTTFGTQLHDDMLILAPANSELLAIDGYGKRTLFGGTSGATPVVAAAMANIASLWPSIDRQSTIKLLKYTSFASAENKLGQINSPRLLNSYKAFKVAQRILSYCIGKKDIKNCFDAYLDMPAFHYFEMELITCSDLKNTHDDFKLDLIKKMRRRALLGVNKQDEQLACAYNDMGFTANAEFYKFRSQNTLNMNDYLEETQDALSRGVFEISYYKYLKNMNKEEIRLAIKNSAEITEYRKRELYEFLD